MYAHLRKIGIWHILRNENCTPRLPLRPPHYQMLSSWLLGFRSAFLPEKSRPFCSDYGITIRCKECFQIENSMLRRLFVPCFGQEGAVRECALRALTLLVLFVAMRTFVSTMHLLILGVVSDSNDRCCVTDRVVSKDNLEILLI